MSIAKRLYILVLGLTASLLLLGSVGLYQMNRVYSAANYGNDNTAPSLATLHRAANAFSTQRVLLYRHTMSNEAAKKAEIESQLAAAERERDKAFSDYDAMVSDERDAQILKGERLLAAEYDLGLKSVLELSRRNESASARDLLIKQAGIADQLNRAINEHFDYNRDIGQRYAQLAATANHDTSVFAIAMVLLTASLGLVFGWRLVRGIKQPLDEMVVALEQLAAGNLAFELKPGGKDEIGALKSALSSTVDNLRSTLRAIIAESQVVSNSSHQLSTAARQMASSSDVQSQSTSAAAASLEELTVSIDHVGDSADDAMRRAGEAETSALASSEEVGRATDQVSLVACHVESSAGKIHTLSEQVQKIGNVTTVIRDVADQTNLLALNAAIEAARAGEQGRGFAVVADEVRKLAERTTLSVQEISSMISAIQSGAAEAVEGMESSREEVADVVRSAERASGSMQGIQHSTAVVQSSVTSISEALGEQRMASAELARNVESIAQMSEENASAAASVADTAEQLVGVAAKLQANVDRFRL